MDDNISEDEWRPLAGLLAAAQDAERKLIAEALHDDTLQLLAAAAIELSVARRHSTDPEVLRRVEGAEEKLRRASESLRSLVFDIYPPDLERDGLVAALDVLAAREFGEDTTIELVNELDREIGREPLLSAYRIVQEALANVRQHALASRVTVRVLHDDDDELVVTVRDDGIGFDASDLRVRAGHLGLRTMRERAERAGGSIEIRHAIPSGTIVVLRLPDSSRNDAVGRAAGAERRSESGGRRAP